jgi:hypothetical protein
MELLGDMGHVESCFDPFEDSVSFDGLRETYPRLRNRFEHTGWYS